MLYACPLQKDSSSPFNLARNKAYLDTHLKEELTDFFRSYQGIPHSHTGRVDRGWCDHFTNG